MNPKIDVLLQAVQRGHLPLYFLFPGKGAVPLDQLPAERSSSSGDLPGGTSEMIDNRGTSASEHTGVGDGSGHDGPASCSGSLIDLEQTDCQEALPKYLLVAVDGTWR